MLLSARPRSEGCQLLLWLYNPKSRAEYIQNMFMRNSSWQPLTLIVRVSTPDLFYECHGAYCKYKSIFFKPSKWQTMAVHFEVFSQRIQIDRKLNAAGFTHLRQSNLFWGFSLRNWKVFFFSSFHFFFNYKYPFKSLFITTLTLSCSRPELGMEL